MVTGDHYMTAAAVAQVTGMLNVKRRHLLIAQSEATSIHESSTYLPAVSSTASTAANPPEDQLGQLLHTRSALPADLKALTELELKPETSNRSKSLNIIQRSTLKPLLKNVSGAQFSSKPINAKPALQPVSPRQSSQPSNKTSLTQAKAKPRQQQPVQDELTPSGLAHARSSEPYMFHELLAQTDSDHLDHLRQPAAAEPDLRQDELSFIIAEEGRLTPLARKEAFAIIAEGHQCMITGPAFEYLVQHADPSLLETVLHNVAVCARFKSHQKAQLVQLLSSQGLTVSNTRKFKVQQAILEVQHLTIANAVA